MRVQTRGIRERLALGTACPHQILHEHVDIGKLTSSRLSESEYRQILHFFLVLYESAEKRRASADAWPEFTLRSAITALREDLNLHSASAAEDMPWIKCAESSIGMLYVLHGASIGGKFIAKHVTTNLPEMPCHFFGRGIKADLWQNLVEALDSYKGSEEAFECILHSATKTFHCFNRQIISVV
ncbi:MAG: biliverdin-producing heme oxygenase [Granulosicoccus sp.]